MRCFVPTVKNFCVIDASAAATVSFRTPGFFWLVGLENCVQIMSYPIHLANPVLLMQKGGEL